MDCRNYCDECRRWVPSAERGGGPGGARGQHAGQDTRHIEDIRGGRRGSQTAGGDQATETQGKGTACLLQPPQENRFLVTYAYELTSRNLVKQNLEETY